MRRYFVEEFVFGDNNGPKCVQIQSQILLIIEAELVGCCPSGRF